MTPGEDAVAVDVPDTPSAPEVHALAGENGSGKSTLVKILSGVHAPDSGRAQIGGADAQPRNPKGAQELGVVTVRPPTQS